MSKKIKKPGSGFAILTEEQVEPPKYQKPKIMLIDIKDDSEVVLKKGGFNVTSGNFGTPYRVTKDDSFRPVIPNGNLENVEEQEIVIIDLVPNDILDDPIGEKVTSEGENDWWVKCSYGIIDPRPRLMIYYADAFDRILAHGGIFIIFAAPRLQQQIYLASKSRYGFKQERELDFDNWSFLSDLDSNYLSIVDDRGKEIMIDNSGDELHSLLRRNIHDASFLCTLHWDNYIMNKYWISLASNKYSASVAGCLLPNKDRKGLVIILPQLEIKSDFIKELLMTALPNISPKLFPHIEGGKWVERSIYEITRINLFKKEITSIRKETEDRVKNIENEIQKERDKYGFLYDLIREKDAKLVEAVKEAFQYLGFKKIIDLDTEKQKEGESIRDEDLQIHDFSPLLLVEVKGVGGLPSDADSLQIAKHLAPRMKELNRHDIQGLSIINHQRHIPALERENNNTFRKPIITLAQRQDVGLLTTWDLFRLVRSYMQNDWKHEYIRDIFYQKGRILPIPAHYSFLGKIEQYWEKPKALSIIIEDGSLKLGDRIAFDLSVEFVEQTVESLQLDGQIVEVVSSGKVAGIKTELKKEEAKKGIRVYRIHYT